VKLLREEKLLDRVLTREEEQKLLTASNPDLRSIIFFTLNTGMRLGEILYLSWDWVGFHNNVIIVEHTKNGKIRKIPMNSELQTLLKNATMKGQYIFGDSITPITSVKTAFHNAIRRAGIPRLRFHDLRGTFATRLVEHGINLVTVKELLGHSSITTTMRYAHPSPENKKQAVESLIAPQPAKNMDTLQTPEPDAQRSSYLTSIDTTRASSSAG
jgi:integrase